MVLLVFLKKVVHISFFIQFSFILNNLPFTSYSKLIMEVLKQVIFSFLNYQKNNLFHRVFILYFIMKKLYISLSLKILKYIHYPTDFRDELFIS